MSGASADPPPSAGISGLTINVLGQFLFCAAGALILCLGGARALADQDGRVPRFWLPSVLALLPVVWIGLVALAVRRGRSAGITQDDDAHTRQFERGLDLILVGCIVAGAVRFVAMDTRVLHVCFAAVGIFLGATRLALARGLGVWAGSWPLGRFVFLVASVGLSFLW
jgi:hypothetical protein